MQGFRPVGFAHCERKFVRICNLTCHASGLGSLSVPRGIWCMGAGGVSLRIMLGDLNVALSTYPARS